MNWNELKEFCESLDEMQLQKKVILWRENEAISNINAEALEETHYINPHADESCYPESEANEPIEDLEIAYEKGSPILHEEF